MKEEDLKEVTIKEAMEVLQKAMRDDSYAIGWQANIAMAFYDLGVSHEVANIGAGAFMRACFGRNTAKLVKINTSKKRKNMKEIINAVLDFTVRYLQVREAELAFAKKCHEEGTVEKIEEPVEKTEEPEGAMREPGDPGSTVGFFSEEEPEGVVREPGEPGSTADSVSEEDPVKEYTKVERKALQARVKTWFEAGTIPEFNNRWSAERYQSILDHHEQKTAELASREIVAEKDGVTEITPPDIISEEKTEKPIIIEELALICKKFVQLKGSPAYKAILKKEFADEAGVPLTTVAHIKPTDIDRAAKLLLDTMKLALSDVTRPEPEV